MTNELISIIVPAYNAELYIRETLDSVLAQTYQNWECIIVNDGSTDNTPKIAQEYCQKDARFKLINQGNLGLSKARNTGINAFQNRGGVISFLDSDDIWLSHHLECLIKAMQEQKADIVGSNAYILKNNQYTSNPLRIIKDELISGRDAIELLLNGCPITPSFTMCKREVLVKNGNFSYHKKAEDFHTWFKLLINDCSLYRTNEITGYYRQTDNSLSNSDRSCSKEVVEIISLFKPNIEKMGINYCHYFNVWALKYFKNQNNKTKYKEAIEYIKSLEPSLYPNFLKSIIKYLPIGMARFIIKQYFKVLNIFFQIRKLS